MCLEGVGRACWLLFPTSQESEKRPWLRSETRYGVANEHKKPKEKRCLLNRVSQKITI